jgi:hypothetical protein
VPGPYKCQENAATDAIFRTWPFRLTSNNAFAAFSLVTSLGLLWLLVGDWRFALVLWAGLRVFAIWVNMIQNYWTHTRTFGTRRYDGRARQRDEHRRMAAGHRDLQRLPAEQPPPLPGPAAAEPRRRRIRLRLPGRSAG